MRVYAHSASCALQERIRGEGSRALCPALFLVGGTLFPDTQGAQYIRAATKLVGQPLRTSYRLIEKREGGGLSLGLYSYMLREAGFLRAAGGVGGSSRRRRRQRSVQRLADKARNDDVNRRSEERVLRQLAPESDMFTPWEATQYAKVKYGLSCQGIPV